LVVVELRVCVAAADGEEVTDTDAVEVTEGKGDREELPQVELVREARADLDALFELLVLLERVGEDDRERVVRGDTELDEDEDTERVGCDDIDEECDDRGESE
jgi:hypothetical protein